LPFLSYYVGQPAVIVRGKPSAEMAARLEKDEKVRLAAQVEKLGPAGLEAAAKALEEAKVEHDRVIPEEILTSFPVPDVKSISWIPVSSVQQPGKGRAPGPAPAGDAASELQKALGSDDELSFFVEYDHVQVGFVGTPLWRPLISSRSLTSLPFTVCFRWPTFQTSCASQYSHSVIRLSF
jgi:hypothetical protein